MKHHQSEVKHLSGGMDCLRRLWDGRDLDAYGNVSWMEGRIGVMSWIGRAGFV